MAPRPYTAYVMISGLNDTDIPIRPDTKPYQIVNYLHLWLADHMDIGNDVVTDFGKLMEVVGMSPSVSAGEPI